MDLVTPLKSAGQAGTSRVGQQRGRWPWSHAGQASRPPCWPTLQGTCVPTCDVLVLEGSQLQRKEGRSMFAATA